MPVLSLSKRPANIARMAGSYSAVSLAYSNASHFTPALRKFTCTRASAPLPSRLTITPSPNLVWNTAWPLRQGELLAPRPPSPALSRSPLPLA